MQIILTEREYKAMTEIVGLALSMLDLLESTAETSSGTLFESETRDIIVLFGEEIQVKKDAITSEKLSDDILNTMQDFDP